MNKFKHDCFGEKERVSKKEYCDWCYDWQVDSKKKKVPVFASSPFGQSGWESPCAICKDCLSAIVSSEIDFIRSNTMGEEYQESDRQAERIPIEIEVIKSLAFMGLE